MSNYVPRLSKETGFTLVELIVTIAIMAILVSMAAPKFTKQMAQARTQQGALDIVNLFSEARASAALSNKNAVIAITTGTNNTEYTISFLDRSTGATGTKTTKRFQLNPRLRVSTDMRSTTAPLQSKVIEATPIGSIQTTTYVTTPANGNVPETVTATPASSTYHFRICDTVTGIQGYSVSINARGIAKYQSGPVSGNAITSTAC